MHSVGKRKDSPGEKGKKSRGRDCWQKKRRTQDHLYESSRICPKIKNITRPTRKEKDKKRLQKKISVRTKQKERGSASLTRKIFTSEARKDMTPSSLKHSLRARRSTNEGGRLMDRGGKALPSRCRACRLKWERATNDSHKLSSPAGVPEIRHREGYRDGEKIRRSTFQQQREALICF